MKPYHTLGFFLAVLTLLGAVSFLFPSGSVGFPISQNVDSTGLRDSFQLHYPKPQDLFEDVVYLFEKSIPDPIPVDSGPSYPDSLIRLAEELESTNMDSLLDHTLAIQYPEGDKSVLYPFFSSLDNAWSIDKPIRIMHYGDSQLEGDRITSYLRAKLQERFGGSGAGLIPFHQTIPSFTVWQDASKNIGRYQIFGRRDPSVEHKRYGVLMNFAKINPEESDSTNKTSSISGWVRLHQTNISYSQSRYYKRLRLFYGNGKDPVSVKIFADGKFVADDSLKAGAGLQQMEWDFDDSPKELTMHFDGTSSPEFYAFSMESKQGIVVDNIPMRGSAGTTFTSTDQGILRETLRQLNVKLFLLQFGGNAVPSIDSKEEALGYGRSFSRQIKYLKTLVPDACVIVVGPADMSTKNGVSYITSPYVEEVRDALRKAAFDSGGAYWDTYEIMGGHNSMPAWVGAKPSLAGPDYIHFTPRGAKRIAEIFYDTLMEDYEEYKGNQKLSMADDIPAKLKPSSKPSRN